MKKYYLEQDLKDFNRIMNLLGYEEVSRKKTFFRDLYSVKYQKDHDVKNYSSLKDRYMPKSTIPFFFVVLFAAIAIIAATTYLIINIASTVSNPLIYFYSLMLPTFISTLIATGISFYRYFVELKNIEKKTAIPLLEKEVE